jgi:hypothetical protein
MAEPNMTPEEYHQMKESWSHFEQEELADHQRIHSLAVHEEKRQKELTEHFSQSEPIKATPLSFTVNSDVQTLKTTIHSLLRFIDYLAEHPEPASFKSYRDPNNTHRTPHGPN